MHAKVERVWQVDCADAWQFTPLHSAASGGHVGAIQKLIALGHRVDVTDYVGAIQGCMPCI